ncbi:hypothetical protein STEG23_023007 [Scotinomys teguina]
MKFAGKWKDLENIILSEVTQIQKDKHVSEVKHMTETAEPHENTDQTAEEEPGSSGLGRGCATLVLSEISQKPEKAAFPSHACWGEAFQNPVRVPST